MEEGPKGADTAYRTYPSCFRLAALLQKQRAALEQAFLREGGLQERMTRARLGVRKRDGRDLVL